MFGTMSKAKKMLFRAGAGLTGRAVGFLAPVLVGALINEVLVPVIAPKAREILRRALGWKEEDSGPLDANG